MFAPIAARFVLVDTEGRFWIRTVGAPRDRDPREGELHQSTREGAMFAATVETELVALDVLRHEARLVVAIDRQ
jgi:hypothetical protein